MAIRCIVSEDSCRVSEYAAVVHLGRVLDPSLEMHLADLLGLAERDVKWVTPWGEDVSHLCDQSATGGFSSAWWTMAGWELDAASMLALRNEFPDRFN